MSKRVQSKIQTKHLGMLVYTQLETFQVLMESTIASSDYNKCEDTINFIAYINEGFVLYSLKREKNHTSCNTIYALNTKTLKHYYRQDSFRIIKKEFLELLEEYVTN